MGTSSMCDWRAAHRSMRKHFLACNCRSLSWTREAMLEHHHPGSAIGILLDSYLTRQCGDELLRCCSCETASTTLGMTCGMPPCRSSRLLCQLREVASRSTHESSAILMATDAFTTLYSFLLVSTTSQIVRSS